MKTNISPNTCRYIINEEQRKVICIIDNKEDLVIDFIPVGVYWMLSDKMRKKITMPKRFVGIATCAPEDEWNEEAGKKIAFVRAKYKLNTSLFKRANTLMRYLDGQFNNIVEVFNNYGNRVSKNLSKHAQWLQENANVKLNLNLYE